MIFRKWMSIVCALAMVFSLFALAACEKSGGNTDSDGNGDDDSGTGFAVRFVTEGEATVLVYDTQDMSGQGADVTKSTCYARDGETGEIVTDGSGQVNFRVIPGDGYVLDSIAVAESEYYNKVKGPTDTEVTDGYRITKITGDLTVTVRTVPEGTQTPGYRVTFVTEPTSAGISVVVYDTQETTGEGTTYTADTVLYARTSDGTISKTGEEQVNFRLIVPEGYEVVAVRATEDAHKNIKQISDDTWRVTKVSGDITITVVAASAYVLAKPQGNVSVFSYTGAPLTFLPDGFDSETMTVTGNVQTAAGTYEAIVSLRDPETYCWSDGSIDPIRYAWSIAAGTLSYRVTVTGENEICIEHDGNTATFSYPAGTAYALDQSTGLLSVTYTNVAPGELEYTLSGTLEGALSFDIGEQNDMTLTLSGLTLTSASACPIAILSAGNADTSAEKGSENAIYDNRAAAEELASAIYATCDLKLKGTGTLCVTSTNNNGIHSKDDLTVQKLTLTVSCEDNALKGNDSVEIVSGTLTLVARSGDGIKTSNTSLSSSGRQKGSVVMEDGTVTIDAASDGIDAAFDVTINGGTLTIRTERYSEGTEATGTTFANAATSSGEDSPAVFAGGFPGGGGGGFPGGGGGFPGGGGGFPGGGGGFPGGDGNPNKGDTSTKGMKANHEIVVNGGTLNIDAYDDAIHANNDETLESGVTASGNITVNGGTLTLSSDDDAIHADGTVCITGGTITVEKSYEGIEGACVQVRGGSVSVTSSDDGINGTATSGTSIVVAGGTLYICAGGDGMDSNSTDSYAGISFEGGRAVIISYGQVDSSIDTERGYAYSGGIVVAVGLAGGMSGESTQCRNFTTIGQSASVRLTQGSYLTVSDTVMVRAPQSMNALVVVLGATKASISQSASVTATTDQNGVCWLLD